MAMPGRRSQSKACERCGRGLDPFGRCRRRSCPGHSHLWAGDWSQVLIGNLLQLESVAMITVTAPGTAEGLAWDRSKCSHPPEERCSGPNGCRVVKAAADRWEADCEARWSSLHRAASERVRRLVGGGSLVASKTWEPQTRGVAHLHLVVPYRTPRERARANAYIAAVKELAPSRWFGHADLKRPGKAAHGGIAAAIYAGKYVAKAAREMVDVKRPVLVGAFLTIASGLTMRAMRWRRWIWRRLGFRPDNDELAGVIALLRAFPELELCRSSTGPRAPPLPFPAPSPVVG